MGRGRPSCGSCMSFTRSERMATRLPRLCPSRACHHVWSTACGQPGGLRQRGGDVFLAYGTRALAQPVIDLANEGEPVLRTGKGAVGDEKEQIAVGNNYTIAVKEHLAEAAPF